MKKSASEKYKKRLEVFESVLNDCLILSQSCAGIPSPTNAHFFASALFTVLCTRGVSFAILAPHSKWAQKTIDHWDYASLAVLTRSIFEIRLSFYYLCVQHCDQNEWECRWNIFNLHDCVARIHLFEEMDTPKAEILELQTQADELREHLKKNTYFLSLSASDQRKLLHGKHAFMTALENIALAAGVELKKFRWLYKFLSSHVHGLPLSFYRIGRADGRGRGVHCEVEDSYSCLCMSFVSGLIAAARDEMKRKFASHLKC